MVDRLGSLTRSIAILRNSLDKPGPLAGRSPTTSTAPRQAPEQGVRAVPSHVSGLASRLAALRRDDPQRAKRAIRLFVEAVLLDELGDELILSADYQRLVDRTVSALESDESLQRTLIDVADELLPDS